MSIPFRMPSRIVHKHAVPVDQRPAGMKGAIAENFARVDWRNETIAGEGGSYWLGKGPRGVLWVYDGRECLAAVEPWRVRRYLYRNVARRRNALMRSYLADGKISLPQDAQIINFGANIGEVAIGCNDLGCKVLALEPDPNVLPALLMNAKDSRIIVLPVAAWHSDGPLPLYLATEKADSSPVNHSDEKIIARGKRIDTLTERFGFGAIHLIVGDGEGSEPEILQGARETLKRTRYVSIRTALERHGASPRDLCLPILEEANFEIIHDENETLIGKNRNV